MGRGDDPSEVLSGELGEADAEQRVLRQTYALHEAGHAVAASVLGLSLGSVELIRGPDSGSSANGITRAMPPGPDTSASSFPSGTLVGAAAVSPEIAWLAYLYAGGVAETRATGQPNPIGRYSDRMAAQNWLADLNLQPSRRREYRDRAEILADEIVAACWPLIEEIAAELAAIGTLLGAYIEGRYATRVGGIDWGALMARVDARQTAGDIPRSFSWAELAEAAGFPPDLAAALVAMNDDDPADDERGTAAQAR